MKQPTRYLPRPLYYLLITTITELILVSGAVIILLPTGFLRQLPLGVLGFLLVYKTIIATIVLIVIAHNRWQENSVIVKGGGLLLGHVVGLLLGGILGGRYGGVFWAIVGIISLYLIVGRIGAKISSAVGNQLDRLFSLTETTDADSPIQSVRPNPMLLSIYGLVVPILVVAAAIFLRSSAFPVSGYSEALPTARIVIIILSLFSVLLPWLLRSGWMMRPQTGTVSRENAIFILGMGLGVVPVIYGFLLFIAFGASILELGAFALASSVAAIFWSANTKTRQNVG
jgi:hypothetical protein